ncbi:hypothetical protein F3Y22_tig00110890pilonHSYRG01087 [Hibiscus syriacus]|uniref:Uncharacterized protein n=1 Tax=Hibiscus syriacus TaxID=106335 RepID=A0A6A2ZIF3_HIBSY|nr:hypothetical protein F3Y22_tig00110890pilonHSYRG01087 [Hibiscus syriacus]
MKRSFRMISQILIVLSDTEEILNSDSDEENKLLFLTKMGKKQRKLEKKLLNEDDHAVHLSIPMIGSGVPTEPDQITQRTLPEDAIGPPYFYYENVALAPVGVWTKMSRKCQIDRKDLNKIVPLEPDEVEMLLGSVMQRSPSTVLAYV